MVEVSDVLENLTVIKRNGKKVDFDGKKIAIAIKKGFDSVEVDDDESEKEKKYSSQDVQKVYQGVLKRIEKFAKENDKLKIEEVQDMIEDELSKKVMKMFINLSLSTVKEEINLVKASLMIRKLINS